jgi:hypothetical protein
MSAAAPELIVVVDVDLMLINIMFSWKYLGAQ